MIVMLMSLNVGAQEMEVFDGSYGYMVTNVVNGEKERCCYITKVEPYSQIDLAGISVGTLIVPSDTVNNVYHVGGNKRNPAALQKAYPPQSKGKIPNGVRNHGFRKIWKYFHSRVASFFSQ